MSEKSDTRIILTPPDPPIRLVAYQPEIPGNLGAMIRLAACFGAPIHVVEPCGFPFSVKALRRSAMDYATRAEIHRHDDLPAFLAERPPGRLLLLSTRGGQSVWTHPFEPGDFLITGRESDGAATEVWDAIDASIAVPLLAKERSLNVSMAAAMALGEAMRRTASISTAR